MAEKSLASGNSKEIRGSDYTVNFLVNYVTHNCIIWLISNESLSWIINQLKTNCSMPAGYEDQFSKDYIV